MFGKVLNTSNLSFFCYDTTNQFNKCKLLYLIVLCHYGKYFWVKSFIVMHIVLRMIAKNIRCFYCYLLLCGVTLLFSILDFLDCPLFIFVAYFAIGMIMDIIFFCIVFMKFVYNWSKRSKCIDSINATV